MKLKPVMPVEVIEWIDAHSLYGWHSPDHYVESAGHPMVCQTVGYRLHEDRTQVILVQSHSGAGNVADSITIPKKNITSRRKLK